MFEWLTKMLGVGQSKNGDTANARTPADVRRVIRSKYDSARQTDDNRKHWSNADALSARSANSLDVRDVLRRRSRYEVANNCHARGITLTMANDMIGTGARLQCLYDEEDLCDKIENAWEQWASVVNLAEKLHTFALAKVVDGESFMLLTRNPNLDSYMQLDVVLIECDQISTPFGAQLKDNAVDGIEFDSYGNPSVYHMLKVHPGDTGLMSAGFSEYTRVPARSMIHWFRADRPGQARGIPEITPALPIFSQLRRYTLAVLMSAEIAADFSLFISTDQPADETDPAVQPFDTTNIDRGLITALPGGYKPFQLQAEQPTTTHDAFTKTLLREACHCLNIPYNIATADFSQDSYAGGRMAQSVYHRYVEVCRKHLMGRVLDRIFSAWLDEATRIPDLLPENSPAWSGSIPHTWFFDAWEHVDPAKESTATQNDLENNTTTIADECAKIGKDWRKVIAQRGKEIKMLMDEGALILPPGTIPPGQQNADVPGANPGSGRPPKEANNAA